MSHDPVTLAVAVTVLFQHYLKTLTDLVELSFSENPLCSTLDSDDAMTHHLHQLLPQLEVINGVRCHSNRRHEPPSKADILLQLIMMVSVQTG